MFTCTLNIKAKELDVYLFHSDTCPHCAEEREYLESIKNEQELNIHYFEVSKFPSSTDKVRKGLKIDNSYVPITIIG